MKYYRRLFSVLLVVVTLFATFSITANAEEKELNSYYVTHRVGLINTDTGESESVGHELSQNGSKDFGVFDDKWILNSGNYEIYNIYEFSTNDLPLIAKGGNTVVTMFDGYYSIGVKYLNDGHFTYLRNIDYFRVLVTYADGEQVYLEDGEYNLQCILDNNKLTFSCEFTPIKDVINIEYYVSQYFSVGAPIGITVYLGEMLGADVGFVLSVNQETEEVGLLKSVINWLSGIKDGITDLFESIKELPSKLWQLISDGLKSLFVPDEEYISNYKDKWDSLLSSRFGVLYQVGSVIFEFGGNIVDILSIEPVDTIPFPYVSLDDVGIPFSFGGYEVDIVPDGFEFIVEAFQLVAVLSAILLTFNALRKRYDNIMGGGS